MAASLASFLAAVIWALLSKVADMLQDFLADFTQSPQVGKICTRSISVKGLKMQICKST